MEKVNIGKLALNKKVIILSAFVLFVIGLSIGAGVAMKEFNIALFMAPIIVFLLVSRSLRKNIDVTK